MGPKYSGNKNLCSPISSNCVIWQGPDIPCIELCNGDTISDVIHKLATELCNIIGDTSNVNPDISGLNLNCLPQNTDLELEAVLQAIIDYVCAIDTNGQTTDLPTITLPECLRYNDRLGNPVTGLPLDQFAQLLGNRMCTIISDINSITLAVSDLQNRVQILENCVLPCQSTNPNDPTLEVLSTCLFPRTRVSVSDLIIALEREFCSLRSAIGNVSLINSAISAQCIFGVNDKLSGFGSYGNTAEWKTSPTTLAESNINQWIVLCDLYAAVKDIQTNCCSSSCDAATFGFSYNTIDNNGDNVIEELNLNFTSSNIPTGYTDCNNHTTITITDSDGSLITQNVDVTALSTDAAGVNVDITSLNNLASLVITVPFCVTDGNTQCTDSQTVIVPLNIPCPSNLAANPSGNSNIVVTFSNNLGTNVVYDITVTDTTTNTVIGNTIISNPTVDNAHTFTGGIPGRVYEVVLTVTQGASTKTCPAVTVLIPGESCTDKYINTRTDTGSTQNIYLGHEIGSENSILRHWYDPVAEKIVSDQMTAPVGCDAPYISSYSITAFGNINLNVEYGGQGSSGTNIELSYSTDGLSWSAPESGVDGGRTLTTGLSSGSVYVRARTSCSSSYSEFTIIRYDFSTGDWLVLANPSYDYCSYDGIEGICPTGIEIGTYAMECDGVTYNVFAGGINSKWFYVGKYQRNNTPVYIYAGWDDTFNQGSGATTIVECCACPAFILNDTIQLFCQEDNSVIFKIPYVLGEGIPQMSITSNPVNGNVTQTGANSNEFVYSNTVTGEYADTFAITLAPSVTSACQEATATIQMQIVPCGTKLKHRNQPIYAFINTGDYSSSEGALIKQGLEELRSELNAQNNYTGEIYFIPTTSNRYLKYHESIIDNGAFIDLNTSSAWINLRNLPDSWGSGVDYKDGAFLIAFVNNSSTEYHNTNVNSNWVGMPRPLYINDYEAFRDAIDGNQVSSFGQANNISGTLYPDGFSGVLYPISSNVDPENALMLHALGSHTGQLIPPAEYGIKTFADVSLYLMQGLTSGMINPYENFTTSGGVTMRGLYKDGWMSYLNNAKSDSLLTEISLGENEKFKEQLKLAIFGCDKSFPNTDVTETGYKVVLCSTGASVNLKWTHSGVNPTVGTFWNWTDPVLGALCGKIVSDKQLISTINTETDGTVPSSVVGCESCSTVWQVQSCETGDIYVIDAATWTATGLEPGLIFEVINEGSDFTDTVRQDWLTSETKCVQLLFSSPALTPEIDPARNISGPYDNCIQCTAQP